MIAALEELDVQAERELYARLADPEVIARCRSTMGTYSERANEALRQIRPSIYREGLADLMDYIELCPWGGLENQLK